MIAIDVTLLGDAGRLLLRNGARPGDRVVVTGALGAAAEGVRLLADGARLDDDGELVATGVWTESSAAAVLACLRAQLDPRPPLALARSIAERGLARAGMDLSDGLSSDLAEICRQSGVGAVIELGALPIDARAARLERARGGDALSLGLHGGEDYQLLLAVAPGDVEELGQLARVWGVEVTAIGEFVEGEPSCAYGTGRASARSSLAATTTSAARTRRDAVTGWLTRRLKVVLQIEDSPTRIALAFALGVFIAFFPILGIHTGWRSRWPWSCGSTRSRS